MKLNVLWSGLAIVTTAAVVFGGAYILSPSSSRVESVSSPWVTATQATAQQPKAEQVLSYALPLKDKVKDKADRERNLAFYKKRVKEMPNSFLDLNMLGGAYLDEARSTGENGWYLFAEQTANKSLTLKPLNTGAWQILFNVAQAKHEFAAAEKLHVKIASMGNKNTPTVLSNHITQRLAQNELLQCRTAAETWVELDPQLSALMSLAVVKEAQGLFDDAEATLAKGISREQAYNYTRSAKARGFMGRILVRQGQPKLAEQFYTEALRVDPGNEMVLGLLGDLNFRQGGYTKARTYYEQAYAYNQSSIFLIKQARTYQLQDQQSKAKSLFDNAESMLRREVAADSFGHRRDLALLLAYGDQPKSEQLKEALQLMEAEYVVRQDIQTVVIYGSLMVRNGQWDKARTVVQKALNQGAVDAELMGLASKIEAHFGDQNATGAYAQAAQAADKSHLKHASVFF